MRGSRDGLLYIGREIDQRLYEHARAWLDRQPKARWISLSSAPGRGNTSLLHHFLAQAENDVAFDHCEKILAEANGVGFEHPPQDLGPLGLALYRLFQESALSGWRSCRRRLANASPLQLFRVGLILLTLFGATCVLAGFHQYTTDFPLRPDAPAIWLKGFWQEFLPQHWHDFPIWLLTGLLIGVPLSGATFYLARNHLLPQPALDHPTSEELREVPFQCEPFPSVERFVWRGRSDATDR